MNDISKIGIGHAKTQNRMLKNALSYVSLFIFCIFISNSLIKILFEIENYDFRFNFGVLAIANCVE